MRVRRKFLGAPIWRWAVICADASRAAVEVVREQRSYMREVDDVGRIIAMHTDGLFETDPLAPRWEASFERDRANMSAATEAVYSERYAENAAMIDAVTFAPMRAQRIDRRAIGWTPAKLRPTDRSGAALGLAVVEAAHCDGCPGHKPHSYFRARMWVGGTEWVRRAWKAAGHTVVQPAMTNGGIS